MTLIIFVIVAALLFGVSPGLTLIAVAVGVLMLDRYDPRLLDRALGRAMKLYAGTTEQFRADARMHRIAEKLRAEYTTQIGHRPAPSEVRAGRTASWRCRCSSTRPSSTTTASSVSTSSATPAAGSTRC